MSSIRNKSFAFIQVFNKPNCGLSLRCTKRFYKQCMEMFLISFQKVQQNSFVRPSLPGDLLISIIIKDWWFFFPVNLPSHFFLFLCQWWIGISLKSLRALYCHFAVSLQWISYRKKKIRSFNFLLSVIFWASWITFLIVW